MCVQVSLAVSFLGKGAPTYDKTKTANLRHLPHRRSTQCREGWQFLQGVVPDNKKKKKSTNMSAKPKSPSHPRRVPETRGLQGQSPARQSHQSLSTWANTVACR